MASICEISKGISKACGKMYTAGVRAVALATYNSSKIMDKVASTVSTGKTIGEAGVIGATDFSTWVGTTDPIKFYECKPAKDTASAQATIQQGANPDAKSVAHQVQGQFNGDLIDGSGNIIAGDDLLSFIMSDVVIAVAFNDGSIKFYGTSNGLVATQWDQNSGVTGSDANGWTFNFQGNQAVYPIQADSDLDWSTIIA